MEMLQERLFGFPLEEIRRRLSYSRRLCKLWRMIEVEFADAGLSLQRAEECCGMSRSQLNRRLNEEIALSFHELLTRYRLLRAAELMEHQDFTFLEIVDRTGFESLSNFGRHFEKVLGSGPREFRSRLRTRR